MTDPNRVLTDVAKSGGADVSKALDTLGDISASPDQYRNAMRTLGGIMADAFASMEPVSAHTVCLVMTVEDADFLGSGVIERLEKAGADLRITCLWNERINQKPWLDIAPIVQEYREPVPRDVDYLIVLKSIISGACVVKTNLQHMLEEITPKEIHVMAPVMLKGAEERLGKEFPPHIAQHFHYWALAVDAQKDEHGNVFPGIGGEVYTRLGLGGAQQKNAILPDVVARRMERGAVT
ncbi:hypothetical protein [Vitreimonas sp.]|uniref:hypothetical protein n=1 Tax=Vitreimonas sp. TaxID=3069702 RepID=UPI002EDAEAB8